MSFNTRHLGSAESFNAVMLPKCRQHPAERACVAPAFLTSTDFPFSRRPFGASVKQGVKTF